VLVPKDNNFRQMSFLRGSPPKVVWLRVGNGGTGVIAELLRSRREAIHAFAQDPDTALLILQIDST
jgi:predicted nuclease of predicted toxin-antitoxin system